MEQYLKENANYYSAKTSMAYEEKQAYLVIVSLLHFLFVNTNRALPSALVHRRF